MTRTHDLLITNQLLYRLSYTSTCRVIVSHSRQEVNKNLHITYSIILLLYFTPENISIPISITKSEKFIFFLLYTSFSRHNTWLIRVNITQKIKTYQIVINILNSFVHNEGRKTA